MTNQTEINHQTSFPNKTGDQLSLKTSSKPISKSKKSSCRKLKPLFKIEKVQRVKLPKKSLKNVLENKIESFQSSWDCSVASAVTGLTGASN